jgi:hypothetical protein
MSPPSAAVQIIIGLVIGIIVYSFAYWAMRNDIQSMNTSFNPNTKRKVSLFDGYYDSSSLVKKTYNTSNTLAHNYVPISPSSNLKGGAQFTYSMWLFVGDPNSAVNNTIFLHGDPQRYPYTITDNTAGFNKSMNDYVAFCPMLSFGANPLDFVVSFNTMNNIREQLNVTSIRSDDSTYRKNLLSLYGNTWVCITIVFEDSMPINDFENGVVVKFYVNDILYVSGKYSSALKQNNGDVVFFPDTSGIPNLKMSNFAYYNYAVSDAEIKSIVKAGPNTKPAVSSNSTASVTLPYYVSEYNKLDLANT